MNVLHPNIIVIGKYINCDTKIKLECKIDGYKWKTTPNSLLTNKSGCMQCYRKNRHEKQKIIFINKIKNLFPNINIIGEYVNYKTKIKFQCKKDGFEWEETPASLTTYKKGCRKCYYEKYPNNLSSLYVGINDLMTTHPKLSQCLVDKNNAFSLTKSSLKKVSWKCPECNNIVYQSPANITRNSNIKISCPACSDGNSYPNKLMYNILNQIDLDFEVEKTFKWCKYNYKNKIRKGYYDFYFKIKDKKYIIEMDGSWHFVDNKLTGQTKEDSAYIDREKENLAKLNDIEVIRIDSRESNLNYIKTNILNSKLNRLLNLSNVNWYECHELSLKSDVKMICDIWNEGVRNTSEIVKITKFCKSTVVKYLKNGSEIGMCDYTIEESMQNINRKASEHLYKAVICVNTGEIFNSIKEACDTYGVHGSNLIKCCKRERNYCGKLEDGTELKWDYYINGKEYNLKDYMQPISENKPRMVAQYDSDNNLIGVFNSVNDASENTGINYKMIYGVCSGKRKTTHNYIFKYIDN